MKKTTALKAIKGPLLITTALLTLYPVVLAEFALTSSDSASASELSSQQRFQTAQQMLKQSLPRTSQAGLLPASLPPLQDLQSTLSDYRQQLSALSPQIQDKQRLSPLISLINQLESLLTTAQTLRDQYTEDILNVQDAEAKLSQAQVQTQDATTSLNNAKAAATTAQDNYDQSLALLKTASDNLKEANSKLEAATTASQTKQDSYDAALQSFNEATSNLAAANATYNNPDTSIQDPTWTPLTQEIEHTRLVPHTTTIQHVTQVPHTTTRTIASGLTAYSYNRNGYNSAPPLPSANETPIATTIVPNINFQWNSGNVLNSNRSEDVIVKFVGFISPPTSGYYRFYAPADDGAILEISGTRIISDWYDKGGGGSTSSPIYLEANSPVPITLYYYENGGGANVWLYYYTDATGYVLVPATWFGSQVITETTYETVITYEDVTTYTTEVYYTTEVIPNQIPPMIPNPDLLTPITEAQSALDEATFALAVASDNKDTADANLLSAKQDANSSSAIKQAAVDSVSSASLKVDEANKNITDAQSALDSATSTQTIRAQALTDAQSTADTTSTTYTDTYTQATTKSAQVKTAFTNTQPDPTPEPPTPTPPTPEPTGSPDIPTDLSAENLMSVDLEKVDPTELTPEQATQLVEAALQTFETATQGSPEYEQALTALYLAAEQDDIEVSPELAALPAIGPALEGAVKLINFLGNAGADMSPQVRAASKKVVVATVAAVGAAVASATSAATQSTTTTRKSGK